MSTTSDPNDPRLTYGVDDSPVEQAPVYLVLSEGELANGYIRPFRECYRHLPCGAVTWMNESLAATYARKPDFYGSTFCTSCRQHRPVGEDGEFEWLDGSKVGT